MKVNPLRTVLLVIFTALSLPAFCQGGAAFEPELALASINAAPKKSPAPSTTAVRTHKRFPKLYSGWAIEIATSTYPMDKSEPIFRQFGNVSYEKLPEGGYSYLIKANFSSKEAGLEFMKNVIKPRAEKAKLIQFNDGIRKVIRD